MPNALLRWLHPRAYEKQVQSGVWGARARRMWACKGMGRATSTDRPLPQLKSCISPARGSITRSIMRAPSPHRIGETQMGPCSVWRLSVWSGRQEQQCCL